MIQTGQTFEPVYLKLGPDTLHQRAEAALARLTDCRLCPRDCGVDRTEGRKLGICRTGRNASVASCNLHHGEEPPISGTRGSGTIFFTHCNLRCHFCQNYPISQLGNGNETNARELAAMMLSLQNKGAHNVNFVTPSHVVPQIIEALVIAVEDGFRLPLVYNCSGYDGTDALTLLDGIIDIYMPDLKYATDRAADYCSAAPDYPKHARAAILEMHRQVGNLQLDHEEIAQRGLLIRHLLLPHDLSSTREVLRFIAEEVDRKTYISLMRQYFPAHRAPGMEKLNRKITRSEYREALDCLELYGLKRGWTQEF
jgi:putative pyruvate formate lyase activating enzyme